MLRSWVATFFGSSGDDAGRSRKDHRTIRCLELFPATFKRLVGMGEAYLSGLCPFIVTLLAVLKCGRPILVPRQVRSSML